MSEYFLSNLFIFVLFFLILGAYIYFQSKQEYNLFVIFAQNLNGTAHLEEHTVKDLVKGIIGRIIQWFALSRLPITSKVRAWLQRRRGVKIGNNVFIGGNCFLDPVRPDLITIEDSVSLAGNVTILTHSSPTEPLRKILGDKMTTISPVVVKKGAWITINCVILPGVTIGENSIVASGSVVNKDVPPYTIVGGSPAKFIRKIENN